MRKKPFNVRKFVSELILLLATIVLLTPIYYFVIGSFKTRKQIIQHPLSITRSMFTLENFPKAIKAMKYWKAVRNTGLITLISLLLIILLASLAGFAIARLHHRVFQIYYSLLVVCMVVPFVSCVIPLVVQTVKLGIHNTIWGPALIQVGWNIPFATFLFTGFMRGISRDLEDAAYIDGCSMLGVYSRIFLPLLAPVTASCCIVCGIGIWNDYLVCSTILSATDYPTLMVGLNTFFGAKANEYGYAFAGVLLSSLPIIVLFLFLQKYFIKGITAGSLKG
ncbi:MAG: carbohydrate ABC transporter permease [Lachnospiraceae bacterium]|nr:carbohydrate ABC transporter permease [Lachnospiraceae bacterium]